MISWFQSRGHHCHWLVAFGWGGWSDPLYVSYSMIDAATDREECA